MKAKKIIIGVGCGSASLALGLGLGLQSQQTASAPGRQLVVLKLRGLPYSGPVTMPRNSTVAALQAKLGVSSELKVYQVKSKQKTLLTKASVLSEDTTLSFQLE